MLKNKIEQVILQVRTNINREYSKGSRNLGKRSAIESFRINKFADNRLALSKITVITDGRTDLRTHGRTDGRTLGRTHGRTDVIQSYKKVNFSLES